MVDMVDNVLVFLTASLFVVAVLLFVFSARFFRRSRTDTYWRRRRDAGQRGLRAFVLAFVLLVASGVTCLLTVLVALIDDKNGVDSTPTAIVELATNTPAPTDSITDTPQAVATDIPPETVPPTLGDQPTPTPADTATPVVVVVTATPEITPSVTPFPTFTPLATLDKTTRVTPRPGASITITALDDRISDTLSPVNPRAAFIAGTRRIYYFVTFRNMSEGVQWTRQLYKDKTLIDETSYAWGLESNGTTFFFFGSNKGFEPGQYEIRLFVGDSTEAISTSTFMILPAPQQ